MRVLYFPVTKASHIRINRDNYTSNSDTTVCACAQATRQYNKTYNDGDFNSLDLGSHLPQTSRAITRM